MKTYDTDRQQLVYTNVDVAAEIRLTRGKLGYELWRGTVCVASSTTLEPIIALLVILLEDSIRQYSQN